MESTNTTRTRRSKALSPLRILLVDDEDLVRGMLKMLLEVDRHFVEAAGSATQALEMFQKDRFDLVITDHTMDGMKGDQLAAAIKALAPSQPIVMLTGHSEVLQTDRKRPQAFDYLITKPCTLETLREAITVAVTTKRLPPSSPRQAV